MCKRLPWILWFSNIAAMMGVDRDTTNNITARLQVLRTTKMLNTRDQQSSAIYIQVKLGPLCAQFYLHLMSLEGGNKKREHRVSNLLTLNFFTH